MKVSLICLALVSVVVAEDPQKIASPKDVEKLPVPALPDPPQPPAKIEYQIIQKKPIPAGGVAIQVLIDPAQANEKDLRKIIEMIQGETAKEPNCHVYFFDDARAAKISENLGDLALEDEAFYDLHYKGVYRKNSITGFHQATVYPAGIGGSEITIDFK
jgi:hypothetical protein